MAGGQGGRWSLRCAMALAMCQVPRPWRSHNARRPCARAEAPVAPEQARAGRNKRGLRCEFKNKTARGLGLSVFQKLTARGLGIGVYLRN